ncbi:MAG: serine hydrolase [Bacteroidetes bacterium]|nr:serine hydrolase [Bacteroidota bacterium]
MNYGKWMAINPDEQYSPGSMMKVVTLLSYLKDSEKDPSILNKRLFFDTHFSQLPEQTIITKRLSPGQSYSVRDLLETMIIDSDNDATVLLASQTNFKTYFSLLRDLQLPVPAMDQKDYPITTVKFSRLFRILFNASYLNQTNSEYALDLLSKSKFHEGLAKHLPANVTMAHKFGERFYGEDQQLHETGIVYLENRPYLVSVMTRGRSQDQLKEILSITGQTIYEFMRVH